jgi:hypothetical protein
VSVGSDIVRHSGKLVQWRAADVSYQLQEFGINEKKKR